VANQASSQLSLTESIRTRPGMWIGGANDCGLVHALTEIVLEVTRIGAISRIDIEITGKLEATLRFKGSLPAEITLNLSTQVVPADQNWYKEYVVATALRDALKKLNMQYPGLKK